MASVELATKVVNLLHSDNIINSILNHYLEEVKLGLKDTPSEISTKIIVTSKELIMDHSSSLKGIIIGGYIKTFSDDELSAILNFYSGTLGKSILSKQEQIIDLNAKEVQKYNQEVILPELQIALSKVIKEALKPKEDSNE